MSVPVSLCAAEQCHPVSAGDRVDVRAGIVRSVRGVLLCLLSLAIGPRVSAQAPHAQPVALRALWTLSSPVLVASFGQTIDAPPAWPQTWQGYGNRLGDQLGLLAVETVVERGVAAALPWHHDLRPCPTLTGAPLSRVVRTRVGCGWRSTTTMQNAAGERRPNLPFLVGLVAATATSLSWRPERKSAVKGRSFIAQRLAIAFGATVMARAVFPEMVAGAGVHPSEHPDRDAPPEF